MRFTYSAQYMLHRLSLSELLQADLSFLRERLPGVPERVLKVRLGIDLHVHTHRCTQNRGHFVSYVGRFTYVLILMKFKYRTTLYPVGLKALVVQLSLI